MNIGVVEVLYPDGHKEIDKKMIKILSQMGNVYYFAKKEFIKSEELEISINIVQLSKQFNLRHISFAIKIARLLNLLLIYRKMKREKIKLDALVLLSIDNSLSKSIKKLFGSIPIYAIHHDDIDKINRYSSHMRKKFNCLNHLVFEEYIKNGLIQKTGCEESKIFVIPHPIVFKSERKRILDGASKCLLGIGWSNDEDFINNCIEISKNLKEKLPYKIVLRSKIYAYEDDNLKVISGFLSKQAYDNLIEQADIQLIWYPSSFCYRYSATFQTALLQSSYVIVNNVFLGKELKKQYPNSVYIMKTAKELFKLSDEIVNRKPDKSDIERMEKKHSDESILNILQNIMKNRLEG